MCTPWRDIVYAATPLMVRKFLRFKLIWWETVTLYSVVVCPIILFRNCTYTGWLVLTVSEHRFRKDTLTLVQ